MLASDLSKKAAGLSLVVLDARDGEPARLTVDSFWNDVVEHGLYACVCEVGSDALPQAAGAEYGDLADLDGHLDSGSGFRRLESAPLERSGPLNESSFSRWGLSESAPCCTRSAKVNLVSGRNPTHDCAVQMMR